MKRKTSSTVQMKVMMPLILKTEKAEMVPVPAVTVIKAHY